HSRQHQDPVFVVRGSLFDPFQIAHCSVHLASRLAPLFGFTRLLGKRLKNSTSRPLRARAGALVAW
ncbi:MAG: hypothetical protein O7F08_11665, partial [Deltaproteobacteria bacterium]|nr:hypothetical protein [Deltaproteobacteria bacterium]